MRAVRTDREAAAIDDAHLLAALLSSPTTALVAARLDGTISRWSMGASLLYGWSEDEVLGRSLTMLLPPDRRSDLDLIARLLDGETIPPFETVRLARDGSPVPVELHLVVLRDAQGSPVGTVAVHRDLSRAARVELALEATEEELRARFHQSPVPQARVDLEGSVLAVNRALQAMLGMSEADLLGADGVGLYSEEDRPAVRNGLSRLASGEVTTLTQEHTIIRPADGARLRALTSVALMHDAAGQAQLAASIEDVTALREAEQQVRAQASRFEALLQTMPVVVFTYDLDGICTSSRGRALSKLGLRDDELVGRSLLDMYAGEPVVLEALRAALEGREGTAQVHVEGHDWKGTYRPQRDPSGDVVGAMGIALEISDVVAAEREIRASEARLSSLLQHASDLALVIDADGLISYASPAVSGQLGYDHEALRGQSAWQFDHPDDHGIVRAALREVHGRPGAMARFECRVRHADGSWRWADHVLTNLIDDPAVGGLVVNVRETTDRRRAEEELRRLAVRDSLTGLPNRTLLLDRVGQALASGRRTGSVTGLVVLDVVGMSEVNERLGQRGGDEVLRALGTRLDGARRGTDSVARMGGDEFAVLVEDVASAEDLRTRASTLLEVAEEPIEVAGVPVSVRMQAGSSLSPAVDAGALLAAAEHAIPHDGRSSRVLVRAASAEADPAVARAAAVDRLRHGIAAGELVLHFQPVLDLGSEEPAGAEALVRWQHPDRGLLAPSEFIPLAEESGLVVELGEWVLRSAVAQLATWAAAGRRLSVGVNLSPRQLVGEDFPDLVRSLLAEAGVAPEWLVLEVTESALMDDPDAPAVLRLLREMGVRLALDDFGTGYSSLTYLKRFPVDAIKIDRSFVAGLGRDPDDEAIVASVVSLARAVGKLVVAEGVETVAQLEALRNLGVDQAQGFLWSRAVSSADLDLWLDQRRGTRVRVVHPAPAAPDRPPARSGSDEQRIMALHREGASLHTIAAALNAEGRRTPAGPRWTTKTVARVVAGLVRSR